MSDKETRNTILIYVGYIILADSGSQEITEEQAALYANGPEIDSLNGIR